MGFFNKKEIERLKNSGKIDKEIFKYNCEKCGLYKNCITKKMEPTGEFKKKILMIGEAPGKIEDEKGIQFVGKSGNLLRRGLIRYGFDLDRDFIKTNSIRCRPENNRNPSITEWKSCRWHVQDLVFRYKPKMIILLGKFAFNSVIGYRLSGRMNGLKFAHYPL